MNLLNKNKKLSEPEFMGFKGLPRWAVAAIE
jgi:hypothetical protein